MNYKKKLLETGVEEKIQSALHGADILLVVPPFNCINYPSAGVQLLQAAAGQKGFDVDILYLNVLFNAVLGTEIIKEITIPTAFATWKMVGERLFAGSAYGLPPLGETPEACMDEALSVAGNASGYIETQYGQDVFDLEILGEIENACAPFVQTAAQTIADRGYKIVGCTACMGQTNASVALLNRIKETSPGIVTLMGGANCVGEMAEGIATLSESVDYVFSGESEETFIEYLKDYYSNREPDGRIIKGEPVMKLDHLPLPDYTGFLAQMEMFMGARAASEAAISYETSRGCWWKQKKGCTFCSLKNKHYRRKSAGKVHDDLGELAERYPGRRVLMTDNIMPAAYHKDLIPSLKQKNNPPIIWMQKANQNPGQLMDLKAANIDVIMVGIEALSPGLLKHINKGETAEKNIRLLRYATSIGISIYWLLLWDFPGDKAEYYGETLALLPLLRHLQPPNGLGRHQLQRYSYYCENPEENEIRNMRPWEVYKMIYPHWAEIDKSAYCFTADYPGESQKNPALIKKLADECRRWQMEWKQAALVLVPDRENYIVYDKRDIREKGKEYRLNKQEAGEMMKTGDYNGTETMTWALEKKLAVKVESRYIPLVTATPELLSEFEEQA
ncbi:MAG: RiPP maturation radical SAM protein 1 [bacterium]|nr:RiPP maturation radical SAM protein 1 [bacterium]